MPTFTASAMLALIEQSPAAVAKHDREGWLALFAERYHVEDPVGSTAVTGPGRSSLERFHDTFIAPNTIRFEVAADYVGNDSVVRDLTIHISMGEAVSVSVPMHLRYGVVDAMGQLRISSLAAHWELLPMLGQLLGQGFAAWTVMASLSARMVKQLGVGGVLGFCRAALTPRHRHYHLLEHLVTAINAQDQAAYNRCFANAQGSITDNRGQPLAITSLKGLQVHKRIAAGQWISASVTIAGRQGVMFAECCPHRQRLQSCVIYLA